MRFISRIADRPYDRVPLGIGEAENGDRPQHSLAFLQPGNRDSEYIKNVGIGWNGCSSAEIRGLQQHGPAFLQLYATYSGYLTRSEAVGRRTGTRGRPQLNPARLQHDAMDSGYLTRSEQKRPGLADCTQHPAFAPMGAGGLTQRPPSALGKRLDGSTQLPSSAPWVSDSGSEYLEPHRCDPFGSKCGKKRRIQCN